MRRRPPNPHDYDSDEDYRDALERHYGPEDRDPEDEALDDREKVERDRQEITDDPR